MEHKKLTGQSVSVVLKLRKIVNLVKCGNLKKFGSLEKKFNKILKILKKKKGNLEEKCRNLGGKIWKFGGN